MACNESITAGHVRAPDFHRALHAMEEEWRAAGFFEPSLTRLLTELFFTGCLLFLSLRWSGRRPLLGGFMMGLAILAHFRMAHESGHQKGFHRPDRWSSQQLHTIAFYSITNLGAGIDGLVWQKEHRLHHAYTMSDKDPQIVWRPDALMPLCALEEEPLNKFIARHPVGSTLLRWQELFFLPTLMLVGKHWLAYLTYQRIPSASSDHIFARKLLLSGHYAMQCVAMWLLVWRRSPHAASKLRRLRRCALWFVGCTVASSAVEPMFLFNHIDTGRSHSLHQNDKIAQVCHTINYAMRLPSWLPLDEYLIPVSYHIEHHLTPKMPDENLPYITADVIRLTSKYGLPYRTQPIEILAWDFHLRLAAIPRDRWGGAGAIIPILLFGIVSACCWCHGRPWLWSRSASVGAVLHDLEYDEKQSSWPCSGSSELGQGQLELLKERLVSN